MNKDLIGKKVIIRSNMSGVHFGTLREWEGTAVRLADSRRLYKWNTGGTGVSLSEVAICGISQKESQITMTLPDIVVMDVCEIIPCHGMAITTIEGAEVHKP